MRDRSNVGLCAEVRGRPRQIRMGGGVHMKTTELLSLAWYSLRGNHQCVWVICMKYRILFLLLSLSACVK